MLESLFWVDPYPGFQPYPKFHARFQLKVEQDEFYERLQEHLAERAAEESRIGPYR